ncbi:MAG: hypothetical protein JWO31_577, partial [Phycisphaerales bacterium]|nr:hypothetical protein [Phycisphaerales bacterium]
AARPPHFAARAKRVIFLFMPGGTSHLDTFDYKPKLQAGGAAPGGAGKFAGRGLLPSPFQFTRQGQSGHYISELFPEVAKHADKLCMLHGMHTDNPAHPQATIQLHTGSVNFVRPSVGAWVLYGLGTQNENLPGYLTINAPTGLGGAQNYGSAFLPATFQGTRIDAAERQVADLRNPYLSDARQRRQLDLIQRMNKDLLARSGPNEQLDGVIESYELGFRMQGAVPKLMDLSDEKPETLAAYGADGGLTQSFGRQCLLARRFAEAGVRFIEVCQQGWDQHANLKPALTRNAGMTDKPIAALLADLEQRDLLKDTLVVWGGEFGRTPTGQGGDGRNHNNRGYTMWMAGGGSKAGASYGATDDVGLAAVDGKTHVHDLHATVLAMLGLDHERLTFRYAGRDFRLTDVYGNVVKQVMA